MASYRFNTGQVLDARKHPYAALAGAYEIVVRLPMSGGDNQYWVKSLQNGDHRVVRESDLAARPVWGRLADPEIIAVEPQIRLYRLM
jgi:hypothetical protein